MIEPTARQIEVLAFIHEFLTRNIVAPTYAEIAERFTIGLTAAVNHVQALEKKQLVSRVKGKVRRMTITTDGLHIISRSTKITKGTLK